MPLCICVGNSKGAFRGSVLQLDRHEDDMYKMIDGSTMLKRFKSRKERGETGFMEARWKLSGYTLHGFAVRLVTGLIRLCSLLDLHAPPGTQRLLDVFKSNAALALVTLDLLQV